MTTLRSFLFYLGLAPATVLFSLIGIVILVVKVAFGA